MPFPPVLSVCFLGYQNAKVVFKRVGTVARPNCQHVKHAVVFKARGIEFTPFALGAGDIYRKLLLAETVSNAVFLQPLKYLGVERVKFLIGIRAREIPAGIEKWSYTPPFGDL